MDQSLRPPAALASGLRRAGILYPFLILFIVLSVSSRLTLEKNGSLDTDSTMNKMRNG